MPELAAILPNGSSLTGRVELPQRLRDQLGDRFVAGLVLNTGSQAQQVDDRISVAPVDELWLGGLTTGSRVGDDDERTGPLPG